MKRLFGLTLVCLASCSTFRNSPKKEFVESYYTSVTEHKKEKVYVFFKEDTIWVYDEHFQGSRQLFALSPYIEKDCPKSIFRKNSLDIDLLTIPLKYRPAQEDVAPQVNANLNGAFYVGYRFDEYTADYHPMPISKFKRRITHYALSVGGFTGLGATFMSPTNTYNRITQEYDGVVWNKGIAGIFAIDNFNLGIALGFDNLLDNNRKVWIYEGKIWLGLSFGLNLN